MDDTSLSGQLHGKYAVDIDGTIRGYVEDVDVEIKNGGIYFHLEMYKHSRVHNVGFIERNRYGPKLKLTLTPNDIVAVGKDCIIIGFGRIPDLKDIERFKLVMAENDGLKKRNKECQEELDAAMGKLEQKEEKLLELQDKLRALKRKEEEFDLVKDELARQKGELQAAREYMKVMEKIDKKISHLISSTEGQEE